MTRPTHIGTIHLADADEFDLRATLESAQSFLWDRTDGRMYEEPAADDGDYRGDGRRNDDGGYGGWYYTVAGDDVVFARQRADRLEWRATTDAEELLGRRLRLDDDLDTILASFPDDPAIETARRAYPGLRVVRDPFFPCLVSFICSARTTVERIHAYRRRLARAFGDAVTVGGATSHAFPRPEQLAAATEADLRELGLGFRAPYVGRTAATVASGELTGADLRGLSYGDAHDRLQSFHGVGPKIADCVALFALGHLEAVPIDTWTRRLIERHYPALARGSYAETASAFRDRFGEYAGYAQTYLYHYVRSEGGR